jgi:rod shape-determining protein MreD
MINAQIMGFLFGMTWDAFSTDTFGVRIITFVVLGYFIGMLNKIFDKNKIFAQVISVFFSNIIYSLILNLFYYILQNARYCNITLSGIIRVIITMFLAPLVFYILDKWLLVKPSTNILR